MKRLLFFHLFFLSCLIVLGKAASEADRFSIAGLYPTGVSQPATPEGSVIVFEYRSDLITPVGSDSPIQYTLPALRNWRSEWSIVAQNRKIIPLTAESKLDQPFYLRCLLQCTDALPQKETNKETSKVSFLSRQQQESIRPEVLLVPLRNASVPHTPPKPPFFQRLFGAKTPKRIERGGEAPPNVVILLIDTLRPDHTPPGGHPFIVAPHIDMLASLSVNFSESYGASSSTRPSVASIFTGLQPRAHGAVRHATEGCALYSGVPFLPEQFLQKGYKTAAVTSNAQISPAFGFNRGFETYECPVWETQVSPRGIDRLRNLDEPFFLYLHYMGPHQPYEPTFPWKGIYKGQTTIPNSLPSASTIAPASNALHDAYAEEITGEDHQIGLLLKEMTQQGLLDRTLLWLVSDHGEEFWEHWWNGHGATVFDETVRTLSILFYPSLLSIVKTIDAPITQVDMYPTLAEILKWNTPSYCQGISLVPLLVNQPEPGILQRPLFIHHGGGDSSSPHKSDKEAILLNKKKLILWPETGKWELYDLQNDPFEQTNLYRENHPEVQVLKPLLESHLTACKQIEEKVKSFSSETIPQLSPEEIENLRRLGYTK